MAEIDRSKRYANPPKHGRKGAAPNKDEEGAAAAAKTAEKKEGEGEGPTPKDPGAVAKENTDKGPSPHESGPEFGVVAERHKREHGDMTKRHAEEAAAMHERHGGEGKSMMARHHKELQDHMESAAATKEEASAGSPKELGKDKAEGEKGSNV
jgi:hypothetical protein